MDIDHYRKAKPRYPVIISLDSEDEAPLPPPPHKPVKFEEPLPTPTPVPPIPPIPQIQSSTPPAEAPQPPAEDRPTAEEGIEMVVECEENSKSYSYSYSYEMAQEMVPEEPKANADILAQELAKAQEEQRRQRNQVLRVKAAEKLAAKRKK